MRFPTFLFLLLPCFTFAQVRCGGGAEFQILHFTHTQGFDHDTRNQSAQLFTDIGTAENFTIVNTQDVSAFDDLPTLLGYEVIVFSNTSGNVPFNAAQRENLENYITAGGAFLGIHAATDMYRDGSFPYYTGLVGGSRRNSPAHTSSNFNGTMDTVGRHVSTDNVPDPWAKQEEYYYWPDTGLVAGITEVLRVQATGSNSYDAARPISWYQTFPSGGRSFYTALGHAQSNYTDSNNVFRQHLRDAFCWCVEAEGTTLPVVLSEIRLTEDGLLDRIDWEVQGERPARVELYGGYDQASVTLLKASEETVSFGSFTHVPTDPNRWFYYRLRLLDGDGISTWSVWLSAAPASGARPQVRYFVGEARLVVPAGGPVAALVTDAAGRKVGSLELNEGVNVLPNPGPGVYFVSFPFSGETLRYTGR